MKQTIWNAVEKARIIGICGHIRPDGDCIGSCMAMYQYIKKEYPQKEIYVYFEDVPEVFRYIQGIDDAITDYEYKNTDLFISLDCSDIERLGNGKDLFEKAELTINIDHHISNTSFADINHYDGESSSACEVLYELLDSEKIDYDIATSLYTGLIHDTGVLKYSNTSKRTLEIAGVLVSKGIKFTEIIDESFYEKTYKQNLILGRCLLESKLIANGNVIYTVATSELLNEYEADKKDTEGVVNALLLTKGVQVAVFVYQLGEKEYKVSLRAKGKADMNKIAGSFNGGGHVKAAGCAIKGELEDGLRLLLQEVEDEVKLTGGCI